MKNVIMGAGLALSLISGTVLAEEQDSMQGGSPSIEEQCRMMAQQHGMKADDLDAWVNKCLEMAEKMHNGGGRDENGGSNDPNDNNDMQDSEGADSGMGGDNQ